MEKGLTASMSPGDTSKPSMADPKLLFHIVERDLFLPIWEESGSGVLCMYNIFIMTHTTEKNPPGESCLFFTPPHHDLCTYVCM